VKKTSYKGTEQYLLDIQFVIQVCKGFLTDKTEDVFHDCCEKALRQFLSTKEARDQKNALKDSQWYVQRVKTCMKDLGSDFLGFGHGL
jgi:hypothetical protein